MVNAVASLDFISTDELCKSLCQLHDDWHLDWQADSQQTEVGQRVDGPHEASVSWLPSWRQSLWVHEVCLNFIKPDKIESYIVHAEASFEHVQDQYTDLLELARG
jgi:hypothetical protein